MTIRSISILFAIVGVLSVGASEASAQAPAADCVVGSHDGFDDADATTAALLICEAVRAQGVVIGEPLFDEESTAGTVYSVRLDRLGKTAFVSLQKESPPRHVVTSRRMKLGKLEEISVTAERLAQAVVKNQSLDSTKTVTNLSKDEGRKHERLRGEFSWGPGVEATLVASGDATVAPGFGWHFMYETPHFDVGAHFVGGGTSNKGGDGISYFAGTLSMHYLFSDTDISPLLGGGLGMMTFAKGEDENDFGVSVSLEGGVEFLRLYSTHLRAVVRVDLPLFAAQTTAIDENLKPATTSSYTPMVSLGVAVLF